MNRSHIGFLPATMSGTLLLFCLVWAAMHDIAHGDEGTIEWTVLAISALAFAGLYRQAIRILRSKAKVAWLIATGLLFSLFNFAAAAALTRPKYDKDPMMAMTFLTVGLPMLGLIVYRLVREVLHARARRGWGS